MTEEIKTKPLNKELLRYFVLIVLDCCIDNSDDCISV